MTKIFAAFFTILFFCLTVNTSLFSQVKDSTQTQGAPIKVKDRRPRNAALMSTFMPGLGQIYNKKYWKTPIIYAALAADIYFLIDNRNKYKSYRDAYHYRTDTDTTTKDRVYTNTRFDDAYIKLERDYFRRNTELDIILLTGIYTLNIIDAYVDAHLKGFDVKESLTIRIKPSIQMVNYSRIQTGLTLNIKFKK